MRHSVVVASNRLCIYSLSMQASRDSRLSGEISTDEPSAYRGTGNSPRMGSVLPTGWVDVPAGESGSELFWSCSSRACAGAVFISRS